MFYSKEEKELLGRYFKYYRKKRNISIKQITSAGLCEYRTYKRVEDGKKVNDDLVDSVMNYFGIDKRVVEVLAKVNSLIDSLYDACECYESNRIKKIIKIIKHNTNIFADKPLIKELHLALEVVYKEYVLKEYLNKEQILNTIPLIKIFNNRLGSLLIEACGRSNMNYVYSNEIFQLMDSIVKGEDEICKYWKARICVYNINYAEALQIYHELLDYYKHKNNVIRNVRIVMQLFNVYRDIDNLKAKEYANKLELIIENDNLTPDLLRPIYYNLGMYYYLKNNFEEALNKYEKSNEIQTNQATILFICSCKSRLNKINDYYFRPDVNYIYYPYLHYYELKAKRVSEKELENYIFSCLLDLLMKEKYEYPFWNMINFELTLLVKKTRNYKKYLEFQEKMQLCTKNTT